MLACYDTPRSQPCVRCLSARSARCCGSALHQLCAFAANCTAGDDARGRGKREPDGRIVAVVVWHDGEVEQRVHGLSLRGVLCSAVKRLFRRAPRRLRRSVAPQGMCLATKRPAAQAPPPAACLGTVRRRRPTQARRPRTSRLRCLRARTPMESHCAARACASACAREPRSAARAWCARRRRRSRRTGWLQPVEARPACTAASQQCTHAPQASRERTRHSAGTQPRFSSTVPLPSAAASGSICGGVLSAKHGVGYAPEQRAWRTSK